MAEETLSLRQPLYLRIIAKIISYIFHPLFIPTYIFLWLTLRFPFEFAGISPTGLMLRKISVFWITAFFPAFSVFLLWRLKFIDSIFLKTQKERIIPYIIIMIFYWWMWYLSRNTQFSDQPEVLKFFFLGIFYATVPSLILNNFFKISMHAIGVGAALTFVILTCFYYQLYLGADIAIITLITGIVCTARFIVSDHTNLDVYSGLIAGALCQVIAYWVAM
jgi:hypothetical protein